MKICLLVNGFKQIAGGRTEGGSERQSFLLANGLLERGHDIRVIDMLAEQEETIGGIRIYPAWDLRKGIPGLRFFLHRLPHLRRQMRRIDADIYYVRHAGIIAGAIAVFSRLAGRKMIWGINHDLCVCSRNMTSYWRAHTNPWSFVSRESATLIGTALAGRFASAAFTQTDQQTEMLSAARPGLKLYKVTNVREVAPEESVPEKSTARQCLWVGKLLGVKGDAELLTLTGLLPNVEFLIIGRTSEAHRHSPAYRGLEQRKNVILAGSRPHPEVIATMSKAPLFINTCPVEGFSNAFLEAWSYRCPVVSLSIDPDRLLSRGDASLGAVAGGDVHKMAALITNFLDHPEKMRDTGARAREYVIAHHAGKVILDKFEAAIREISAQ